MSWEIGDKGLLVPDGTPTVCWDLDSTLRSSVQRRYLLPEVRAGRATWDDYSHLADKDTPIPGAVALLHLLSASDSGIFNIAVTGASAATLEMTQEWCEKHDVPLDDFMMRPAFDTTENGIWKVSCVRKLQAAGMDVRLFIEDWEPVAQYIMQETGIPVLGVNPFDPDAMLITQDNLAEALVTTDMRTQVDAARMAAGVFAALHKRRDDPGRPSGV